MRAIFLYYPYLLYFCLLALTNAELNLPSNKTHAKLQSNQKKNSRNNLAFPSMWYKPSYYSKIVYGKQNVARVKSSDYQYYAIAWPQDSIYQVIDRVLSKGMSPFPGQSVTVYPDEMLEDLVEEQEKRDRSNPNGDGHSQANFLNSISSIYNQDQYHSSFKTPFQFHDYHNPYSFLHYDTQMSICSAMSMFIIPKVLIFGTGLDSPLFCKAVMDIHPLAEIYFVEDNEKWAKRTEFVLKELSTINNDNDDEKKEQCHVIQVNYGNILLDKWMDYIGNEEELAETIIHQLPSSIKINQNNHERLEFDVILVDGPRGSELGQGQHGRMASLSTASKLLRKDGMGILFMDDFNRHVELVYGRYLFRPTLGKEQHVMGWGNTRQTVFFTKNNDFKDFFVNPLNENVDDKTVVNDDFLQFWRKAMSLVKQNL